MTSCRVRGLDAHIEWQITEAHEVEIRLGVNQTATVTLKDNPRGYTFQPQRSGPVSIEARNRFGTARVELGDLILYELPQFRVDLTSLPAVYVPEINSPGLPGLDAAMAGRPRTPTGVKVARFRR